MSNGTLLLSVLLGAVVWFLHFGISTTILTTLVLYATLRHRRRIYLILKTLPRDMRFGFTLHANEVQRVVLSAGLCLLIV